MLSLMRSDFCLINPSTSQNTAMPLATVNNRDCVGGEESYSLKLQNGTNDSANVANNGESTLKKIRQQGIGKTIRVFLARYAFYVIHRMIR